MKIELNPKTKKYERIKDPTKLVSDAVMTGITQAAPKGWLYHMSVVSTDTHPTVQQDPKTGLKALHVKGIGALQKIQTAGGKEKVFPRKNTSFEVEFKEDFDQLGLPDIKVVKFNFKDFEV